MAAVFDRQKKQTLEGDDQSRKGSIDAPIVDLINFINEHNDFFTTSSCSGRISVGSSILCYSAKGWPTKDSKIWLAIKMFVP